MRAFPLLLLTVAFLGCLALSAPPAAPPAQAATGSGQAARPAPARPGRPLADSVLLRINGREEVTLRRFERAVRLLGGHPDSLTPVTRDQFLDLVIEQRVLAARALERPRPWARADSLRFMGERDNILLRAALSDRFTDIERRRRAQGQPDLDERGMGVAARESLMAELRPVWDTGLLRVVGSYFAELPQPTSAMSPREQLAIAAMAPKVPAAETLKVLARSRLGEFRVAELLADWRRLSSVYRPRVTDDEGVKALVQNSLFERVVREAAADPKLEKRDEVAAVIADRREYHGVTSFLQREVIGKIPTDSLTLERHYKAHLADFDRPARAVLVLLTLDNSHSADSMARRLAVPGEAESLAFRAQRGGVRYTHVATMASDSALYLKSVRTGVNGVAGPDQVASGWRVFKVLSLDERSRQAFADVKSQVERAWYEVESERRIRSLLDGLKRAARIERNEAALRRLVVR